ncbi:MAG: enoyl-CoA hydratase/isomerase family protein [Archangium sp.]|nr:enoyl-CoA hydratase/isomerase family protein [Archangium sp.]
MADWQIRYDGDVAVLQLDDGKANALLVPEFASLERALDEIAASKATAVIITGRPGFFSAGLNLKVLSSLSMPDKRTLVAAMGTAVLKLFLFPKPVVAAISGHALGGGAMFALAADVRLFADGAFRFGLNEVPAGLFVPSYAIALASAAISPSRMTELVVHGRVLSPAEAHSMHVGEAVHAPESLMQAAMLRAKSLSELSGTGYAITKRLVRGPLADAARAKIPAELDELAAMLGA